MHEVIHITINIIHMWNCIKLYIQGTRLIQRRKPVGEKNEGPDFQIQELNNSKETAKTVSWKRILLLIVAITVHNIPGLLCIHQFNI